MGGHSNFSILTCVNRCLTVLLRFKVQKTVSYWKGRHCGLHSFQKNTCSHCHYFTWIWLSHKFRCPRLKKQKQKKIFPSVYQKCIERGVLTSCVLSWRCYVPICLTIKLTSFVWITKNQRKKRCNFAHKGAEFILLVVLHLEEQEQKV